MKKCNLLLMTVVAMLMACQEKESVTPMQIEVGNQVEIVGNCANIAFIVGGERMMQIEVPTLVEELYRRLHKTEDGE